MCRVLRLSESGYYRWLRNRDRHSSRQLLAGKVKKILEEHPDNRNYGVNRVCLALEQDGAEPLGNPLTEDALVSAITTRAAASGEVS